MLGSNFDDTGLTRAAVAGLQDCQFGMTMAFA